MKKLSRRGILAVLAGGAVSAAGVGFAVARGSQAPPLDGESPVVIRANPFAEFASGIASGQRAGLLDFVGGLDLACDDKRFGGLSGLSISADGRRLLACSDHGTWFSGTLDTVEGRPSGISGAVIAPILGPTGRPLSKSRRYDTEALAMAGGFAYLGLERVHEVLRLPFTRDGLAARGEPLPTPPDFRRPPSNRSFEAVAVVPSGPHAGSVLAVAERSADGDDTPTQGYFFTGPRGGFTVARRDGFDITDMAFLPSGDLLLLERRFAWLSGLGMRIRRVDGRSIRPGALLDGPTLISVGGEARIDNMEGLAVHRDRTGIVLTLVSDDNFSMLQRTVLLQFRMDEAAGLQRVAG